MPHHTRFFCFFLVLLSHPQASGLYQTSSFYLGRSMAETPFHLLFGFLVGVITSVTGFGCMPTCENSRVCVCVCTRSFHTQPLLSLRVPGT